MEASFDLAGTTGTILLSGALTLPFSGQLKNVLMQSLANAETIIITLRDVEELDLSLLQLLCSAHRMALRENKQMLFSGELPEVFRAAVGMSGFRRHVGCVLDSRKSCIWAGV